MIHLKEAVQHYSRTRTGVCLSVVAVALVANLQSDSGEDAGKNGPEMSWFNFFLFIYQLKMRK